MTHQFKFGDIVRDAVPGLGVCVVINTSEHFVYIMNSHGDYNPLAKPADLELIPRPDTARLDWLADPANEIGKVMLPGWCSDEYNSLRDAIDAAMQEQAAEAEEQP